MPTNSWPIVIEGIVRLFGSGLFQWDMSRITGVSQGHIQKVLRYVNDTSSPTQGFRGHQLKIITWTENRVLLSIIKGNRFLLQSGSRVELSRRIRSRILSAQSKTFSSFWILINTFNQMPQTDSWSSPPASPIDTPSKEMEPSTLVPSDICWWVQGQPLTIWLSCFSDATIH